MKETEKAQPAAHTSMINVKDVLNVLSQNNFPNDKQIELLQILDYALITKHYPNDIHEIINRKIQLLKIPSETTPVRATTDTEQSRSAVAPIEPPVGAGSARPDDNPDTACAKVRSVIILELLKKLHLGKAHNDLTKICKLIAYLTGNSYKSIYTHLQKGISLSKFHRNQIKEANKILTELDTTISLDENTLY